MPVDPDRLVWLLAGGVGGGEPGSAPTDTDHDGIPDSWEAAHGLDPTVDDSGQPAPSCFTWLEEYLNSLVD